MPQALFFNVPGHGHINPSLALVTELSRRGHHITYFATESYRAKVEAAGAKFQAYAAILDNYFDARGLHGGVPQKVAYHLITTTEQILPELLEIARAARPDYILYDGMCPWGYFTARILGLPAVVSLALMAPVSPPPQAMLNWQMLGLVIPMLLRDFDKGLKANLRGRALGKKYNVPSLGPTSLLNAPGDLAISYTSSYFQPFANTAPDTVCFVGWTLGETPASQSFSLDQMQGRRLIYVSLGTLNNKAAAFFKMCIAAFAGRDDFVLMSTGNGISPEVFGKLPENIAIHLWVPQTEVLKQAALFITHGGLNSIHDGLYCGVPLLLVPQQEEQTFNALRVVELGAGLMLKNSQVTAQTLRSTTAKLLAEARFKAESNRVGDTLRAAGGAARAANEIESLLRKQEGRPNTGA
jgi:MGT family glycosyltransferase